MLILFNLHNETDRQTDTQKNIATRGIITEESIPDNYLVHMYYICT